MKKLQSTLMVALVITSMNNMTAHAASFNCRNPDLSTTEKIICSNADLSKLDDKLNETFKALLSESSEQEKKNTQKEQRQWLTETRDKCIEEQTSEQQTFCLFESYRSRIADLDSDYMETRSDNMLNKELPELSRRSGISVKEIEETLNDCDSTQFKMNRCSRLFSLHIELAMGYALDRKLKSLPAACHDQLKAAQAKWKSEMDSNCYKSANELAEGGSMAPTLANMCIEGGMKARIAQIRVMKSCDN